ncbi:MAG: ATP synthase F1 subunit delta [Acidimicrobiia bacterium]
MAERVDVYAQALLQIAESEGHLGDIEDELFRFARIVDGNDELRMALGDRTLPAERRTAIVDELLDGRAMPATVAIISFIVTAGRGHDLTAIVQRFVELAAETRQHEVAEVRSAVPLDDAQQEKLAVALSKATGKRIEVKVIVDEKVMGGLVATIGDTVIDGTVRHRLAQLKETI